MKKIQLKNVVWQEGNHFVAQCLNVDISSFGYSKEEALKNLSEALLLYFEDNDNILIHDVDSPELFTSTI